MKERRREKGKKISIHQCRCFFVKKKRQYFSHIFSI